MVKVEASETKPTIYIGDLPRHIGSDDLRTILEKETGPIADFIFKPHGMARSRRMLIQHVGFVVCRLLFCDVCKSRAS